MKSKNGFTLIEVIAVIFILGVILAIMIPNVNRIVNNGYKEAYEIDLESLVDSAKSYILLKNIEVNYGVKTVVTFSEMKASHSINTILDYKTKEPCDGYVVVTAGTKEYIFKPYLMCSNYTSDGYGEADMGLPEITLFGDSIVSLQTGQTYIDAGAMAYDNDDGDISKKIVASASISPNKVGIYTITYNVKDNTGNAAIPVTRTVYVVDPSSPTITLLGDSEITIEGGTTYVDAGATALDDADGDITDEIVTTNTVNMNNIGTYTVTYNVKDHSNNAAAPKVRTVNIIDTKPPIITAKEASFTINKGDSNVISSSYFNISTNGVSPITSTVCVDSSNGNAVVSNTSSLAAGTHIIKCTLTKQNTLTADATVSLVVNQVMIGIPNTTYSPGASVTYGGVSWYVVSDNGANVTLISRSNLTTSAFGSSNSWTGSTANTYLNSTWLNNNTTLVTETETGGIIYDTTSASYVRLITKGELKSSIANYSGTNFWTMTPSGSDLYYALSNGSTSYTSYTTTANVNGTCYSGVSSAVSSIESSYIANSLNSTTAETIANPADTTAEKATLYEKVASGSCLSTYSAASTPYNYDCECSSESCNCSSYSCVKTGNYDTTYLAGSSCTNSNCTMSGCIHSACAGSSCYTSTCAGTVCYSSACAGSSCTSSRCSRTTSTVRCVGYNSTGGCTYSSTSSYCAGSTCAGYSCTRSTCRSSGCAGYACGGYVCTRSTCDLSGCVGSICSGWTTSYGTSQTSGNYNSTCTTCSSTCESCSTCTGSTTTYSASGSAVNWNRYVVTSQTSSMGIRAVITVKKK